MPAVQSEGSLFCVAREFHNALPPASPLPAFSPSSVAMPSFLPTAMPARPMKRGEDTVPFSACPDTGEVRSVLALASRSRDSVWGARWERAELWA